MRPNRNGTGSQAPDHYVSEAPATAGVLPSPVPGRLVGARSPLQNCQVAPAKPRIVYSLLLGNT